MDLSFKILKVFMIFAAAALATSACAPTSQIVLLPDPDGKVGKVDVSGPKETQRLERAWESTETSALSGEPGNPRTLDETQVKAAFKEALAAQPMLPASFIMYFSSGSSELVSESKRMIPKVLEAIKERNSTDIIVSGHTDTVGSEDYNRKLSLRRARAVEKILLSRGIEAESIEVTYHGKGNPLVPTGEGVAEPRNRRVEITVR